MAETRSEMARAAGAMSKGTTVSRRAFLAAVLSAGEAKGVSENPEERSIGRDVHRDVGAVDVQREAGHEVLRVAKMHEYVGLRPALQCT